MNLLHKVEIFVIIVLLPLIVFAEDNFQRLFIPDDSGVIPEKLIVTHDNALFYKSFTEPPIPVRPLFIFWRLKDKHSSNPKDPVIEHNGKKYYCVGSPTGEQWGYIETSMVTKWQSRFVYALLPPQENKIFRVYKHPFSIQEFPEKNDSELDDDTVLKVTTWSQGVMPLAFILNNDNKNAILESSKRLIPFPNDFKPVMFYNGSIDNNSQPTSETRLKNVSEPITLDIVFVIQTTGKDMEAIINQIIRACENIKEKMDSSTPVHFGLVEYQNNKARVVSDLSESYNTFIRRLKRLKVTTNPTKNNDVLFGIRTAINKSQWHNHSYREIFLVGNTAIIPQNKAMKAFSALYEKVNPLEDSERNSYTCFHAIVGGNNNIARQEFQAFSRNCGNENGYFACTQRNDNIKAELTKMFLHCIDYIQNINNNSKSNTNPFSKKNNPQNASIDKDNRVFGYACAKTTKGDNCAVLGMMILYDELEDVGTSLEQMYKTLDKCMNQKKGNIKTVMDQLLEEYHGITRGTATDSDYEQSLVDILGIRLPIYTPALNMSLYDVMKMRKEERQKWLEEIKMVCQRAKDLKNKKNVWIEQSFSQETKVKYAIIPVHFLP